MKPLLVVLSAAVISSLSVYAVFSRWIGVMGPVATMDVDTLVWLFAVLAFTSSAVTLGVRAALIRSERGLHARIAELEKQRTA
jgi:hypothetical protein